MDGVTDQKDTQAPPNVTTDLTANKEENYVKRPSNELGIVVDLTSFDTTVNETSSGKGNKTAEQDINPNGDDKSDTNSKVGITFSKANKTILNEAAASQAASTSFQSGVTQSLVRTIVISLSYPGSSDSEYSVVALVDTGAGKTLIKPSVAQAFGTWIESKVPITSFVVATGVLPVNGQVFLNVRIGDSVLLHGQRFLVGNLTGPFDVILGNDFHDAVGSLTFNKDSLQVNGGETIPYATDAGGNSVLSKVIRMNPKGDHKTNTNPKVETNVPKPNKTILNKAAASQAVSTLSQSGQVRTAVIKLSNPGKDMQCSAVALVDSGGAGPGGLIKSSVAQALGISMESKVAITSIVTGGTARVPVYGFIILDVHIGDFVLHRQQFVVVDFEEFPWDAMLSTASSVTFHEDSMQVNGESAAGSSAACKSTRTDQKTEASHEEDKAGVSD